MTENERAAVYRARRAAALVHKVPSQISRGELRADELTDDDDTGERGPLIDLVLIHNIRVVLGALDTAMFNPESQPGPLPD